MEIAALIIQLISYPVVAWCFHGIGYSRGWWEGYSKMSDIAKKHRQNKLPRSPPA